MFLVIGEEKPAIRYYANKQPSPVQDEEKADNEENERSKQEQGKKSTFKKDGANSNFVADEDSRKDNQDKKQK